MAINTRESRISLDSGYSDEKNIAKRSKSKTRRNREKSCQRRKVNKKDISKPLNDLRHTAHIGTSGESFGDIAADISKVADISVFDKDFITKALMRQEKEKKSEGASEPNRSKSRPPSCEDSETHEDVDFDIGTNSTDTNKEVSSMIAVADDSVEESSVVLRHKTLPSCLRHSVISWNLEFDSSDILSSVLAVMDQLNADEGRGKSNRVKKDPIYDEVPVDSATFQQVPLLDTYLTPDENRSIRVQRTETIIERIIKKAPSNSRPNFKPPPPKEAANECLYDIVGLRQTLDRDAENVDRGSKKLNQGFEGSHIIKFKYRL